MEHAEVAMQRAYNIHLILGGACKEKLYVSATFSHDREMKREDSYASSMVRHCTNIIVISFIRESSASAWDLLFPTSTVYPPRSKNTLNAYYPLLPSIEIGSKYFPPEFFCCLAKPGVFAA